MRAQPPPSQWFPKLSLPPDSGLEDMLVWLEGELSALGRFRGADNKTL